MSRAAVRSQRFDRIRVYDSGLQTTLHQLGVDSEGFVQRDARRDEGQLVLLRGT